MAEVTSVDARQAAERLFGALQRGDLGAAAAAFTEPEGVESSLAVWLASFGQVRQVRWDTWRAADGGYTVDVDWQRVAAVPLSLWFRAGARQPVAIERAGPRLRAGTSAQRLFAEHLLRSMVGGALGESVALVGCELGSWDEAGERMRCGAELSSGGAVPFEAVLERSWEQSSPQVSVAFALSSAIESSFERTLDIEASLRCDSEFPHPGATTSCAGSVEGFGEVEFAVLRTENGFDLPAALEAMTSSAFRRQFSPPLGGVELAGGCDGVLQGAPRCRLEWAPGVVVIVTGSWQEGGPSRDLSLELDWDVIPQDRRRLMPFLDEIATAYSRGMADYVLAQTFGFEMFDDATRLWNRAVTRGVQRAISAVWGGLRQTRWRTAERTERGLRVILDATYERGAAPLAITVLPSRSGLAVAEIDPHFETDESHFPELLSRYVAGVAGSLLGVDLHTFPCSLEGLTPETPVACQVAGEGGEAVPIRVGIDGTRTGVPQRVAVLLGSPGG